MTLTPPAKIRIDHESAHACAAPELAPRRAVNASASSMTALPGASGDFPDPHAGEFTPALGSSPSRVPSVGSVCLSYGV